ncbi:hypothetical protein [Glycomyces arizonensis]|uniref:hypothetical protein n=1 Tax=Glycomyces arizonensis TaxID=256035 RepID=UPI00041853B8|nr:hypothetical protein [Glycomyces arizonensis]
MAQRILDPDYLTSYRDELQNRLDFVTDLVEQMRTGNELGVEPGFGLLDASQEARNQYTEAHQRTWDNLQKLRADLNGAIVTINESLGLHAEAEETNVSETSAHENDLDS